MSFELVRGDLAPSMPVTITVNNVPLDTSSADTVIMRWVKPDGTVYETNLTPVDPAAGEYEMDWGPDDTDTIGPHVGEVVVTTAGIPQTFPSDGQKIYWWVNPNVADLLIGGSSGPCGC